MATVFIKYGLIGGTSDDLDFIDGADIAADDVAFVYYDSKVYNYKVVESGTAENIPDTISPDANAGTKRWELQDVYGLADPSLDAATLNSITINPAWPSVIACEIWDTTSWRDKTAGKTWRSETVPSGSYLGLYANETAARAAGGTTNDWYARTTTVAFYQLSAGSGETQIYRAGDSNIPAKCLVVAWADRMVIFDATKPGMPMFCVFTSATNNILSGTISSITVLNQYIMVGTNGGLFNINFLKDTTTKYSTSSDANYKGNISQRNGAIGY